MAKKLTKQDVLIAAEKVLEYDEKLKALHQEYSQYRRIFRLTKVSTITDENSIVYPLQDALKCDSKEAREIAVDVCKYIFAHNPEVAFDHIERNRHGFISNERVYKYKDICLESIIDHPDKMFKLFHYHTYNYRHNNGSFQFTDDELDMIWDRNGQNYLKKVKNTVIDFYMLFVVFPHKFSYENKELLVKRVIGRKKRYEASMLVKHKHMPEDLVNKLNAYLVFQKLI